MAATGVFAYTYTITKNNGGGNGKYTLAPNQSPRSATIKEVDQSAGQITDNPGTLGEISSDTFQIVGVDGVTYTYVGSVGNVGSNQFIASYTSGGQTHYMLFSDTAVAPGEIKKTDFTTVICFLPGTQIATPAGEVAVEMLQRGDLVKSVDGRTVPVRWIGRQTVSMLFADPLRVLPICIKAGALAKNVPSRDLYVSPDHAILIDDILVHASALVNGTSIVRAPAPAQTFTYYHVELADHSLLLADNVPAESFIDNVDRMAFDNWDEHEALGDEAAPLVEMAYPRAKAARQVPVAMRERLAARARALFGTIATQAA
jgi:hypothetical protein